MQGGKYILHQVFVQLFSYCAASLCLSLCGQSLQISFLLFSVWWFCIDFRICNFSLMHKSHILSPGLYACVFCVISHFTGGLGCRLCCHTHCDSAVAFFLYSVLKVCVCPLYLVLKSFSVLPMYCLVPVAVSSLAVYITASVRHCPSRGQFALLRQLHVLALVGVGLFWFRILML